MKERPIEFRRIKPLTSLRRMKKQLHQLVPGERFKCVGEILVPPAHRELSNTETLTFWHIDGMYSYCMDANNEPVHPAVWQEVEMV